MYSRRSVGGLSHFHLPNPFLNTTQPLSITMSPARQDNTHYGYCLCDKCNGQLRTRQTITAHSRRQQFKMTPQYRICHCTQHPWGEIVHRNTRIRHRSRDLRRKGASNNVPDPVLREYLADPENTGVSRASILDVIQRAREDIYDAQFILDDPECDEILDEPDNRALIDLPNLEDPEERDREEILADAEATAALDLDNEFQLNGTSPLFLCPVVDIDR